MDHCPFPQSLTHCRCAIYKKVVLLNYLCRCHDLYCRPPKRDKDNPPDNAVPNLLGCSFASSPDDHARDYHSYERQIISDKRLIVKRLQRSASNNLLVEYCERHECKRRCKHTFRCPPLYTPTQVGHDQHKDDDRTEDFRNAKEIRCMRDRQFLSRVHGRRAIR